MAAAEVFIDQGFGGASMDAISAAAGVSKATVYAYFSNKEGLFAEIVGGYCREQQAAVAAIETEHPEVEVGLRRIAETIIRYISDPRALAFGRMIMGEANRFPALGQAFVESGVLGLQQEIAGFLEHAHKRGELKVDDPQLCAELFINMVRGPIQLRALRARGTPPSLAELSQIASGAAQMMLAGCGGVQASAKRAAGKRRA